MKLPVVRYSPAGAVLDTWSVSTHHAFVMTLAFQETLQKHTSSQLVYSTCELSKKNETIYYVGIISNSVCEINICPTFIQLSEKLKV